jgi:DNA polymerase-3 subunit delta
VFVIYGNDESLVSSQASQCFADLTAGTDPFSHETIDGTASDSETAADICYKVCDALQTLPFFPGLKVVWLKGCTFLGDSPTAKSETTEEGLRALSKIIESGLPTDVKFLISASEFDKRRAFNKMLCKLGESHEYNKPDISQRGWEEQLIATAKETAQKFDLQFDKDALDLFIHRVSENYMHIVSEIEKLSTYIGGERKNITADDVSIMVPQTQNGIIFEISRALERRDLREAIRLIDFKLENGDQAVSLMRAAIIPTLRNMIVAKAIGESGHQASKLPEYAQAAIPAKKDGSPNLYALKQATAAAARFSLANLKTILASCQQADKALVSSSEDPRLILHRLAAIICA